MLRHRHKDCVRRAMPGTSMDIARRCGISVRTVQRILRYMMAKGEATFSTRWSGSMSYTRVYRLTAVGWRSKS